MPRKTPLFDNLDEKKFNSNVRSAEAGPCGLTCNKFRPFQDNNPEMDFLFVLGEFFSSCQKPHEIVQLVQLGRMTALRKKDGGVRGMWQGR